MKVTIITAAYNSEKTISACIESVASQTYPRMEHIIIDGGSKDSTLSIIRQYRSKIAYWVSEPDEGMYDAMNKGIQAATGDLVGILNSDDVYADNYVVEKVVETISDNNVDSCYGDLVYVDRINADKVIRYWKSGCFYRRKFRRGWMPPHPTFFVKKSIYEKYGSLNTDFPLAADYELMLRFLYKYEVSTAYIPEILIKMRTGGTSNPWSYTAKAVFENYRSWKINNLNPKLITFALKPLSKILQFRQVRNHIRS